MNNTQRRRALAWTLAVFLSMGLSGAVCAPVLAEGPDPMPAECAAEPSPEEAEIPSAEESEPPSEKPEPPEESETPSEEPVPTENVESPEEREILSEENEPPGEREPPSEVSEFPEEGETPSEEPELPSAEDTPELLALTPGYGSDRQDTTYTTGQRTSWSHVDVRVDADVSVERYIDGQAVETAVTDAKVTELTGRLVTVRGGSVTETVLRFTGPTVSEIGDGSYEFQSQRQGLTLYYETSYVVLSYTLTYTVSYEAAGQTVTETETVRVTEQRYAVNEENNDCQGRPRGFDLVISDEEVEQAISRSNLHLVKQWQDGENAAGVRPEAAVFSVVRHRSDGAQTDYLTLTLAAEGECGACTGGEADGVTVTFSDWGAEVSGLPQGEYAGTEFYDYTYTVEEVSAAPASATGAVYGGYVYTEEQSARQWYVTAVNTLSYQPFGAVKYWDDDGDGQPDTDTSAHSGDRVRVTLEGWYTGEYGRVYLTEGQLLRLCGGTAEVILDGETGWSCQWGRLPVTVTDDSGIVHRVEGYRVRETGISIQGGAFQTPAELGYESVCSGYCTDDGTTYYQTITNTRLPGGAELPLTGGCGVWLIQGTGAGLCSLAWMAQRRVRKGGMTAR